MLAKGKKTSNPDENSGESPRKGGVKNWYENNQRSIIAVALIAIVAFVLRFVFAYGTSVDNGTALSGGTSASEHLRAIVSILDGGSFIGANGALNYPFGSTNVNPVLYDLILTPFALIGKAMGMTSVAAASTALAWGAIVFGVLATIMAYFVGKEFLGEKKHGYLAAAFIAFCPVVIANTVFSNGTEIAFVAFLFMLMSFFLVRGAKNIDAYSMPTDRFSDIFRLNKTAMKYAVISGILFALIILSWNGFRSIANALCVVLAIMVLVDRFRKKDSRVIAIYFSIVLLIAMVAATAYYVPSGLWDAVLSGVLISTLLSVAICLSYASLQKVPWTITIPVYAIVLVAFFLVLYFVAPDYFNAVIYGNSIYAENYGTLVSSVGISVSQLATNYGFITVWFPFIAIIMMVWKLPKNINSPAYLFTIIWMCFGVGYGVVSDTLSVIYAPAYAIGFAYIIGWLFEHVKFKDYFDAIRASDVKSVWKKLLKPIPFLSIVAVLLLICAPNALYAIDASIPSNDTNNHEGLEVGALNYYIRTSDDWKVNDTLSQYSSEEKTGAMLTWTDYSNDASTFGGFSVTTDSAGNGAVSTALTLLANGKNNEAVADMTISLIRYYGIDASKDTLLAEGMSPEIYSEIKEVFDNPGSKRADLLKDPETYGAFATTVSDESIIYAMCSQILTGKYDSYQIAEFYDAMVNVTGKSIDYVMITGDMIPVNYGGSSTFASMAKMAGYVMYDDYGTVSEFESTDSTSMYFTMYYTGVYSYTDSMTDSLLWRSYIGMSPAEAGFTGYYASYNYLTGLMLSDGTVKATPGYGLANFEVDESSWYVKYNAKSDATTDSDGWVKMLAKDAQALQEKNGGLINYLAGYPIVMKYVSNQTGTTVSGVVSDSLGTTAVKGVRVSVIDENGLVRSSTLTDANGRYNVVAREGDKIQFISASTNLKDGTVIKSVNYTDPTVERIDVNVPATTIEFKLVDSDGKDFTISYDAKVKFVGQNNGITSEVTINSTESHKMSIVPDIYDVTVTDPSGKNSYATATYTVVPGENTMYKIKVTMYTVTVSVVDDMGVAVGSEYIDTVKMTDTTDPSVQFSAVNEKGTAKISVIAGTYSYSIMKGVNVEYTDAPVSTVSADTSVTVTYYKSTTSPASADVEVGLDAVVYAMGYQGTFYNGSTNNVPTGTAGNAVFTVYSVNGTKVLLEKSTASGGTYVDAVKVSGVLKNSSDTAVSGTIVFIIGDLQVPVSSDSDGKYSVMLPKNTSDITIYAQYGTEVCIEKGFKVENDDIADKELKTGAGLKITGNVYWYSSSSSRVMRYVPVTVTYDGIDYNLVTDSSGAYTMYLPADSKCSITATVDGTNFYFDTAGTKTQTKTDSTGGDFTAKVSDVTVQNNSGYTIKFSSLSDKTESGKTATLSITSTSWYVTVYQGDNAVLSSVSVPVSVRTIGADYFDVPKYTKVSFDYEGEASTDKISITSIANDDDEKGQTQTISSSTHDYFFERGATATDAFEYLITLKDTDSTKIGYAYISLVSTDTADITVTMKFESSFTVTGFAGLDGSGTVTVVGIAVDKTSASTDYKVDTTDGTYSLTLPLRSTTYCIKAEIESSVGNYVYKYAASRDDLASTGFEAGKEYVRNMAVTDSGSPEYDADVKAVLSICDEGMKDSEIKMKVNIENMTGKATYLLSAGDSWQDLVFYSDVECTNQIASVVVDAGTKDTPTTKTVYAIGKIAIDKIGLGTDGLSVNVTDINSDVSCVGILEDSTNWVKSGNNKSTIEYGSDAVSNSEYKYAISITNGDNYTKSYSITEVAAKEGNLTDSWFVTYVDGDNITSTGANLKVLGYETTTLYVKITVKDASSEKVPAITFKVKSENAGETFTVGEGTEGGITITGDTASVSSSEQKTLVNVSGMSADGRGVFNEYGDTPVYVWVLFGIAILLVMLVIWLGLKRGVFSRKK